MKTSSFTLNEIAILKQLYETMLDITGGEFGMMDEVSRGKFTNHEFAGYVGSLQKKGVFEYLVTQHSINSDVDYKGQYALTAEAFEFAKTLT